MELNNLKSAEANRNGLPNNKNAINLNSSNQILPFSSLGLIYGKSGVGKTYLASTVQEIVRKITPTNLDLPEGWKCINTTLFLNAEMGSESIPSHCRDIVIKNVEDYKTYAKAYEFLKYHLRALEQNNVEALIKYQQQFFGEKSKNLKVLFIFRAVVIDSITEIQKYCLYDIRNIDVNTKIDEDLQKMLIADWGVALDSLLLSVRKFRNLPLIKIYTGQELVDIDDKGKRYKNIALQGQAKASIQGFFDYVGYYVLSASEKGNTRRLWLNPIGDFSAKNRFEKFNDNFIDNPIMESLLKYTIQKNEDIKKGFDFSF